VQGGKYSLTDLTVKIIIFDMKIFVLCISFVLLTMAACSSTPTISPTATGLFVDVVSVAQSPTNAQDAIVHAKTSPGAECTIVIQSPAGSVNDPRLTKKIADKKGDVSWTLRLNTTGSGGAYIFTVTAILNNVTKTGVSSFQLK
jgi:hypothetical protein